MLQPKIIDNSIHPDFVDDIERQLFSTKFPWYYTDNIAQKDKVDNRLTFGFCHLLYSEDEETNNTDLLDQLKIIVTNNMVGKIMRARCFMHTPVPQEYRLEHDAVHTDLLIPHMVCLYYVNDSDGDTLLFNKTYEDPENKELELVYKVPPKKGRVLIFDGRYFHCSTPPSKTKRCIINFNIV